MSDKVYFGLLAAVVAMASVSALTGCKCDPSCSAVEIESARAFVAAEFAFAASPTGKTLKSVTGTQGYGAEFDRSKAPGLNLPGFPYRALGLPGKTLTTAVGGVLATTLGFGDDAAEVKKPSASGGKLCFETDPSCAEDPVCKNGNCQRTRPVPKSPSVKRPTLAPPRPKAESREPRAGTQRSIVTKRSIVCREDACAPRVQTRGLLRRLFSRR